MFYHFSTFRFGGKYKLGCLLIIETLCFLTQGLLPSAGSIVKPVVLKEFDMQPRGTGSSAKDDEWKRSRYTMSGSHYLVYFQLTEGMVDLNCSEFEWE